MRYTIRLSDDKTFIALKIQGDITRKAATRCHEQCHAKGKELGINRFLVDVTEARNVDRVVATYDFAYRDMNSVKIDKKARVAMLARPDDSSHDFVVTTCRNAGHNVTLFTDRELAEGHLHSLP